MTTIWHRLLAVMIILAAGYAVARTGGASACETTQPGANRPLEPQAIEACIGKQEGSRVYVNDSPGIRAKRNSTHK